MFGQLSLEGLTFEPTKKSNNNAKQKPAAQGQTKSDEKKAAAKKATKPEVSPLAEDTVIAKGKLFCPPAVFDIENKSVAQLKELLKEKSFLEAEYFVFFKFGEAVVAALPYSTVEPETEVSPEDRMVREGDSVSVPLDDGTYCIKDLRNQFVAAYPEYDQCSVIKLADGLYAPIPKGEKEVQMAWAFYDVDYPIPSGVKDPLAALTVIPELSGINAKTFPLTVKALFKEGAFRPHFFYQKSAQGTGSKVAAKAAVKAEKKVKLPVKVCFTFGAMPATLTAEDFGGESSVPMQKIKDIVLDKYTALKDVKTDFCYMENVPVAGTEKTENLIQVLVYMQGKGAFFPTFDSRQEAEAFLDDGGGDAARFHVADSDEFGKVQRVPAGTFVQYPNQALHFSLSQKMPKEILRELIALFRLAMPLEDAARVYIRRDGTFFVHHLTPTVQALDFVQFEDADQPEEALSGDAALFCEVHSHNSMPAFFSGQDFRSAVYPGLYVCIGRLDRSKVEVACCAQMDWKTVYIPAGDVFEASFVRKKKQKRRRSSSSRRSGSIQTQRILCILIDVIILMVSLILSIWKKD